MGAVSRVTGQAAACSELSPGSSSSLLWSGDASIYNVKIKSSLNRLGAVAQESYGHMGGGGRRIAGLLEASLSYEKSKTKQKTGRQGVHRLKEDSRSLSMSI